MFQLEYLPLFYRELKSVTEATDFMVNAPILFSIFNPLTGKMKRILARVKGIGFELSSVSVENDFYVGSTNLLPGATFNLFIKYRTSPKNWVCIHMEILDNNFEDRKYICDQAVLILCSDSAQTRGWIPSSRACRIDQLLGSIFRSTCQFPVIACRVH